MKYPCALVRWFLHVGESPDENTGMWVVELDVLDDGTHHAAIIHLDSIFHAAHLIAIYGEEFVLNYLSFTDSLDAFCVVLPRLGLESLAVPAELQISGAKLIKWLRLQN
jgi:hypothetical protein